MSPLSRMRKSRDNWKMKNSQKRKQINQLRRLLSRQQGQLNERDAEILRLTGLCEVSSVVDSEKSKSPGAGEKNDWRKHVEEEIQRLTKELDEMREENRKFQEEIDRLERELELRKATEQVSVEGIPSVQVLCVFLIVTCGISFRSIPKVLRALITVGVLSPLWIPHFTSVINWTLRLGTYLLSQVKPIDEQWIAIMDTSIDVGIRKAIVVLRVRLSALKERGSAITLQDCQVIFLKIVESSTGEVISECLKEAFRIAGRPVAILKDGGKDLNKGTLIYREENRCKSKVGIVADLGHFIANALKAEFSKVIGFKRLLTLVYGGHKRLRQTKAAAFIPPKLRTKGRFQGISRLADWALWILDIMAVPGQVKDDSTVAALRKGFPKLPQLRPFIEKFARTCKVVNEVQELLKNKGLNQETYKGSLLILQQLPESSYTRQQLQVWLIRHLGLQCRMSINQTPLLVSSDAIESLMGKLKSIIGRASIGELNRMTLILPTLCGQITPEIIAEALEYTSQADLQKTEKDVIPITLLQQRRRDQNFIKPKKEVPKTLPLELAG